MNHLEGHDLIGAHAWNTLVAHYGGCELPVPGRIDSGSGQRLAEKVGPHAAQALISYAGGDTLYIAAGWGRILAARYAQIRALRDERGLSYAEIARTFEYTGRYSERNIRMILSGDRWQMIQAMMEDGAVQMSLAV